MTDQPSSPSGDDTTPSSESPGSESPQSEPNPTGTAGSEAGPAGGAGQTADARRRRRGSRGGQRRRKGSGAGAAEQSNGTSSGSEDGAQDVVSGRVAEELPEPMRRTKPTEASDRAIVRKPQIGDTRPAPPVPPPTGAGGRSITGADRSGSSGESESTASKSSRGSKSSKSSKPSKGSRAAKGSKAAKGQRASRSGGRGGSGRDARTEAEIVEQRRGRERKGKPIGRYSMCVQVRPGMTQIAVLEGLNLIEHYVSRPADDVSQIHGNIYVGRVQNVLPGMEAAFVDIATPKNAVLYRGDVQYDPEDIDQPAGSVKIEQILKQRQLIVCQVTKNPIGAKGARLTQEVSLPGRFVVLIPNSATYGISKRLPDDVRRRLRQILDRAKPAQHGVIVRTAAEFATEAELLADMEMLLAQWADIEVRAAKVDRPTLLHREPELAVRVIREEFTSDYRRVIIDDPALTDEIRRYVEAFNPELADRIESYDPAEKGLSLFERYHVHEQVHKALDRKVWLPSGGSLIIEHTEALTVIDVNTGKNVGSSNLEETVFHNNLEAAEEIAKQLRLRDIGGIIVIDFIDMEVKANRAKVVDAFREALARDKTRTQIFDISELGLVEMTRKRIGEGLLTEFSETCELCAGRGVVVDTGLLD